MNIDNYLSNLETIVNIDSGSECREGIDELISFFQNLYSGFITEIGNKDKTNPYLIIKNRESENIDFLFIGHLDTVFPKGTAASRPFSIKENLAYGAGVIDMKSGCLMIHEIVSELKDSSKNICVIYNSDEEIGSECSHDIIRAMGEKSKYAFVFEPARKNGNMVKERKGILHYEICFRGRAAHSGINPQDGISANLEAAYWALEMSKLEDLPSNNSLNIGTINGGTALNIVSDCAKLSFEARSFDVNFFAKVKSKVNDLIKNPYLKDIKVEIVSTSQSNPLFLNENTKKLIDIYDKVKKEMSINFDWESTGGGSDANILGGLNVAVVDGLGPIGGELHSEREYLEIDSITLRYNLSKKVIESLL